MDKTKEKDNEKHGNESNKKQARQQKWIAFKAKARSRKGYIVLISIFVALCLIANVILIFHLVKQ